VIEELPFTNVFCVLSQLCVKKPSRLSKDGFLLFLTEQLRSEKKRKHKKYNKDKEQDFSDASRSFGDACESKQAGDYRDHKKN
jgi:hypothetical protein